MPSAAAAAVMTYVAATGCCSRAHIAGLYLIMIEFFENLFYIVKFPFRLFYRCLEIG